jgi:RNA polymerase sigma-70 factor, ECF subfamily
VAAAREQTQAGADTLAGSRQDLELLSALRRGDERAFAALVDLHSRPMLRRAMVFVSSRAVAEEVVQEAWLGVIKGLGRFEGRSALKTWIFRILTNCAKTRAQREGRSIPFSALWNRDAEPGEPSVNPDRFLPPTEGHWPNHWSSSPRSWDEIPEHRLLTRETGLRIEEAIDELPPAQREVITLRDVEGWGSEEVCELLGISEGNQRVLLHRARSRVRRAHEQYLDADCPMPSRTGSSAERALLGLRAALEP